MIITLFNLNFFFLPLSSLQVFLIVFFKPSIFITRSGRHEIKAEARKLFFFIIFAFESDQIFVLFIFKLDIIFFTKGSVFSCNFKIRFLNNFLISQIFPKNINSQYTQFYEGHLHIFFLNQILINSFLEINEFNIVEF